MVRSLKAILFDFNGIIINDEPIHQELISEILLAENLRPSIAEFREVCIGRTDRSCIRDLMFRRGRVISDEYLDKLIIAKAKAYHEKMEKLETLPIYHGIADFLAKIAANGLAIGLVTGALRQEVDIILNRVGIASYFKIIVSGDEITKSKPEPEGYLLAVQKLNELSPDMSLNPSDCLVIEDSFAGITAAKRAGMQVVGVANTYPFHMMQRRANWAVDYVAELEIERIKQVFEQNC